MAFTITKIPDVTDYFGKAKVEIKDFKITGTYTAGGYTVNAVDVGFKYFKAVDVAGGDVSQGTYFPLIDFGTNPAGNQPTSFKLRFFTATGVEATGTLSPTINVRLLLIGG